MKAIVLAGGIGSRLFPVTKVVSKQLLPVYDKPMVYYPLSVLFLAGIKEVLLISTPQDINSYKRLLGDGSQWGITLQYKIQEQPKGLAEAFLLGEEFIGSESVCLILGDNIFYGNRIEDMLLNAVNQEEGATVFAYYVQDPDRYGVVSFDSTGKAIDLEEKPVSPKSNYAVTGIYMYDSDVVEIAKAIRPSTRGELEITDVNKVYLERQTLRVELFDRGTAWLDTGTLQSLLDAANFIRVLEERQGLKIRCPEEIAYQRGFIDARQLQALAKKLDKGGYGKYLMKLIENQ